MYDVELKRKWDRANILAYAKSQGRAEGLAEGEAKGKEKSLETVIINSSKNGLTLEQIQAITGWEKDRITEVLKRNHL